MHFIYLIICFSTHVQNLPQCFGINQLPIEVDDGNTTNSKFTAMAYEDQIDYFAIGGVYGNHMITGLYVA
ncbi:UNKNOWN [Stylonychia lemnae]|uniref:Uncharacterized protein n=1 Tax=Stylonychia lemnae TaxID=5949 RepID=A0A078AF43_STYLE|nr:UNKNOWN [Stylonychia lemnae]|eukprot:CDW80835.1 UNKNOWN [Stylonychia lemnae]